MTTNFGKVTFADKEYTLTSDADITSTSLDGRYVNYHEAAEGEEYSFQMSAQAIDEDGVEHTVYWIFEDIKGSEKDLDGHNYDNVDKVVEY